LAPDCHKAATGARIDAAGEKADAADDIVAAAWGFQQRLGGANAAKSLAYYQADRSG